MVPVKTFVQSLLDAVPSGTQRIAVVSVLTRWAGQTIYIPMDNMQVRRRREARRMADAGLERGEIVETLRDQFGISARTAARDVSNL